ncbi:MAG TPA: hypothetical protein VIA81_01770 [Acidimicrobiia bacterium]|jgi:hypothetical protein
MSFHRFVYLCGWTAVILLTIAGFAAFNANPAPVSTSAAPAPVIWGEAAGAVSVQGWLAQAGNRSTAVAAAAESTAPAPAQPVTTPSISLATGWLDSVAVRSLVETYFASGDVNRAVRLAWCVSRFDIDALNPSTGTSGLFQIDLITWTAMVSDLGLPASTDPFDPAANTAVAAHIVYEGDGWFYWSCE